MIKAFIEKEYKVLISKDEYDKILDTYKLTPRQQINYYYNSDIKGIALRTRLLDNQYFFTLKVKNPEYSQEYEFAIADASLNDQRIKDLFEHFKIKKVTYIGQLTTDRSIIPLKKGEICLDHSTYLGTEDYEIEYELYDADNGNRQELEDFLKTNNIADIDNKHGKFFRFAALYARNNL